MKADSSNSAGIADANSSYSADDDMSQYNEILVQATASIRLKSNSVDDIDNAVLQWYYYCEYYIQKAWKTVGYNQSSLKHAYDWVQIDDSTLDVFFMGNYIHHPDTILVHCLNSTQTMRNNTSLDDACSQLTLGGFGDDLTLASRAKLDVKTKFEALLSRDLQQHTYMVKSVKFSRMSFAFSPAKIQQQRVVLQAQNSRISIFDHAIVQARNALGSDHYIDPWCRDSQWSPNGHHCLSEWIGVGDGAVLHSRFQAVQHGADICVHLNTRNRKFNDAKTWCANAAVNLGGQTSDDIRFSLAHPSGYSDALRINHFVNGNGNVWHLGARTNPIDDGNNRNCKHTYAWSPVMPDESLWDGSEPSCRMTSNHLQIRTNGKYNDESPNNDQTKTLCQSPTACKTCNSGNCDAGFFREHCYIHQNWPIRRLRRAADATCLACAKPACKVNEWRQICNGKGLQRHPQWGNTVSGCQECTANCDAGHRQTTCNGNLEADNSCVACLSQSCNERTNLAPSDFGYFQGVCADDKSGNAQLHPCLECTQSCSRGDWNGGCKVADYNQIPACIKCAPATQFDGNNCPATFFLVLCDRGISHDDAGIKHIGKNSCNKCPAEMVPIVGAESLDDCVCKEGAEPIINANTPHPGCQLCDIGFYSKVVAANVPATCVRCPIGQSWAMTTSNIGTINVGGCICPAKFFRPNIDSLQCFPCPPGTTSIESSSLGQTKCSCDTANGFMFSAAGCTACAAGKYVETGGDYDECVDCQAGKYRNTDQVMTTCNYCETGKYSVAGSAECSVCGAGQGLQNGICTDCAAGTFSDGIVVGCRDCGPGEYAPTPGSDACDPCEFGGVSSDRSNCILRQPPKILSGENKVVFMHFKAETTVKSILAQVSPQNWQNGDTVTIYENGARGLNPLVFVYNTDWSPVNIDPIHHRDNVYVIRTPRSDIGIGVELMSIVWQDTSGVELLSGQDYTQTISMQVHYLRKQHGVDLTDTISTLNADYSYYRPFGVRIINNLPTHTTNINYAKP